MLTYPHGKKLLSAAFLTFSIVFTGCSCQNILDSESLSNRKQLQEYQAYDYEDTTSAGFSYMESTDANLRELEETYHLASIAGDGDELSRILNLMLWVNNNIRHSGSAENPYPPNALHIIETCKRENRAVNCRMMATVLSEMYLSLGYKSRIVTCEPYEHEFTDCHVVTVVYSMQLGKWVMMDPSFAGYFQDKDGVLLDLSEMRENMVNNEEMIVSDHLNHNHATYTGKTYRNYMLKNVFRFSSPQRSEFNYEARDFNERRYIELLPVDYESMQPQSVFIRNPDVFWANPLSGG